VFEIPGDDNLIQQGERKRLGVKEISFFVYFVVLWKDSINRAAVEEGCILEEAIAGKPQLQLSD
jgi:hypothetical protein